MLRRLFGFEVKEIRQHWTCFHNVKLYYLYSCISIIPIGEINENQISGHIARMEEISHAYEIILQEHEEKRTLEMPSKEPHRLCTRLQNRKIKPSRAQQKAAELLMDGEYFVRGKLLLPVVSVLRDIL
jgi:hypothetical protein